MPTIGDLETKVDELAVATEAAQVKKASAAEADQQLFGEVVGSLKEATIAARRAHGRLAGQDAQVRAAANSWVATSSARAEKVGPVDTALAALRSDLEGQLGFSASDLNTALAAIEALDDTLQSAVDTAASDVDTARDAWVDAHAAVTKAQLNVERLRSRIGSLPGQFSAALERAKTSMAEARRLMAREEAGSNRAAAAHTQVALAERTRIDADFGSGDDAIDSDAGNATVFTGPWESAYNGLVDAEHVLHERSLELQQALLAEAEAVAALREYHRGLPYDADLEPIL